jgi:hypothetical protein
LATTTTNKAIIVPNNGSKAASKDGSRLNPAQSLVDPRYLLKRKK